MFGVLEFLGLLFGVYGVGKFLNPQPYDVGGWAQELCVEAEKLALARSMGLSCIVYPRSLNTLNIIWRSVEVPKP